MSWFGVDDDIRIRCEPLRQLEGKHMNHMSKLSISCLCILSEYDNSEELVKSIDILGREIKAKKGFYFDIYGDGKVVKMYQIQ